MKRIFIAIICIGVVILIGLSILKNLRPEKIYVKKISDNRFQLVVDNKPYIIKGVVYSPVPIGKNHRYDFWSDPLMPHLYDGKLMKAMGVNTIRVYKPGQDVLKTKEVIRDLYNKFGIRVAMGNWLGFRENQYQHSLDYPKNQANCP